MPRIFSQFARPFHGPVTRIAPSPTGALHLGNARTFLVTWAVARREGWKIVLRMDDLDGPRIKPGADREAIDILQWLGIDWDEGPYYQTQSLESYASAWKLLAAQGRIYPCHCTRSQIQAASLSAPQSGDHELRYPGTCRPNEQIPIDSLQLSFESAAWRLRVPDEPIAFHDQWLGPQTCSPQEEVGDFLVFTKQGAPAYQLAVVCDDTTQGIDRVFRGDDLLTSTARQSLIYQYLGAGPVPLYWHLPLVVGNDGRRLAKRHGDSRIASYRAAGVPAERIIGLLGEWCGLGSRKSISAVQFAESFTMSNLPRERIVFTPEDDLWLTRG